MGRIMAIDFGLKRCGIAVSDPTQMIASGLKTVPTHELFPFLQSYLNEQSVDEIVLGYPRNTDNTPSEIVPEIEKVSKQIQSKFNGVAVAFEDERFTSKMAVQAMVSGGLPKQKRKDKGMIDQVSATIILQGYLDKLNRSKS